MDTDIKELSAITRHRSDIYFSAGMISELRAEKIMAENEKNPGKNGEKMIRRSISTATNFFRDASGE
jgi:hypothetical protein